MDDTLVRTVGTKRIPMTGAIAHVRSLHSDGAQLFCWSSGGGEYARSVAEELGVAACFAAFLPKPNVLLDDRAMGSWRRLVTVHPAQCESQSVATYRQAVAAGQRPIACPDAAMDPPGGTVAGRMNVTGARPAVDCQSVRLHGGIQMAAFDQLDWTRFDVWAAVAMEGVAVVEIARRDACHAWLGEHGYTVTSVDFAQGVGPAVMALGEKFRWEEQFGYRLTAERRNLDALRDGFEFDLKPGQGHVLELLNSDVAHKEDPRWLAGLLAIAHEYSRWQLALGARFFATLFLDPGSPLIGAPYETLSVPVPFRTAARHGDPFAAARPAR